MLSGTLGNLLSGLSDEDETFYLAVKAVDPLVIFALLVITSADENRRPAHGFDALNSGIGIGSLGIVVIIHTALGGYELNSVLHCVETADHRKDRLHGYLHTLCDISEQISLASKEASGTGNMKFMLNGAVTLGTSDGANVEIHELVGDDNIYIFGQDSDTVIKHYEKADYVSKDYYKKSPVIKEAVDFIVSKEVLKVGKKENLERLYNELLNKDWFMTLLDLEDYIKVKDQAFADYEDQQKWKKMMLVNIAKAGFFSSDRTIAEYNRDIWKLK